MIRARQDSSAYDINALPGNSGCHRAELWDSETLLNAPGVHRRFVVRSISRAARPPAKGGPTTRIARPAGTRYRLVAASSDD